MNILGTSVYQGWRQTVEQTILAERFRLEELIGSGGVSSVYRATDLQQSSSVAVKILHPHLSREPHNRALLKNEIELTSTIDSPAVIQLHDVFEDGERLFVSMELLEGGDLWDRILDLGPLPFSQALEICTAAARGLDAAHKMGIIHCDIKPHNILFAEDGSLRISDFGFARTISGYGEGESGQEETSAMGLSRGAGTPDYAAPELMGSGLPDPRADIYSLGVVLFEMLTGRLPYQSSSPQQTLHRHLNEDVPRLEDIRPGLPEELQSIIERAMAKMPGDRFQTAGEFAHALEQGRAQQISVQPDMQLCPSCGAGMYREFPLCVRCGYVEARIACEPDVKEARGQTGTQSHPASADILIVGPGEIGERLNLEHRHSLVEYLKRLGSETKKLEKRIPRLPFFLFRGLEASNADELAASISHQGIQARVIRRDNTVQKTYGRKKIFKKFLALYPRMLLVVLGFSGGFYYQIFNSPQFFIPIILVGALVVAPAAVIGGFFQGEAAAKNSAGQISGASLARRASRFHQPQARSIIQRITVSLCQLENMPGMKKQALEFYNGFLDLINEAGELDAQLHTLGKDSSQPGVRSRTETTLQRYLDRMLRYSVTIDRYRLASRSGTENPSNLEISPTSAGGLT